MGVVVAGPEGAWLAVVTSAERGPGRTSSRLAPSPTRMTQSVLVGCDGHRREGSSRARRGPKLVARNDVDPERPLTETASRRGSGRWDPGVEPAKQIEKRDECIEHHWYLCEPCPEVGKLGRCRSEPGGRAA